MGKQRNAGMCARQSLVDLRSLFNSELIISSSGLSFELLYLPRLLPSSDFYGV